MKTSLTKLSSSFLLLTCSFIALAKPVAQVTGVTGAGFVVTPEGKTIALKINQHLEEKSEVMLEEGASATLNDYYDATYHMIGGTHLKFYDKSVQLKNGKTWIQSLNSRHPLALTTANGHVDFWKGEFITTFDQGTSRSQVLVVNGDVEVSNILDRHMKYTVTAGTFTIVDPSVESGLPRTPTKVGLNSLNVALSEFKQLPEKMRADTPARGIASVADAPVKKGEIIFIKTSRMPASVSAHSYYKKKVKRDWGTPVPIRIYGVKTAGVKPVVEDPAVTKIEIAVPREPASVPAYKPQIPKGLLPSTEKDQEFSESLKMHQQEQPKYPKELDNLIQDLKSF